jgi:NAD(P)H-hydrate epimerase
VAPISIPDLSPDPAGIDHDFLLPQDHDIAELLPARPRDSHKGDYGKLLIVTGSRGMSGAARLVATAALRSGVGLVRVACPESIRAEVAAGVPEAVTIGLPETQSGGIADSAIEVLKTYLDWPDVIAVGPGLKTEEETALFLKHLFSIFRATPFVIDADALNLIAAAELDKHIPPDSILTPHPGEFARITQTFRSASLATPLSRTGSSALAESSLPSVHGGAGGGEFVLHPSSFYASITTLGDYSASRNLTVVLKGSPTVSSGAGQMIINPTGNPGLASGGTGDVLTGIISALWAQGLTALDAAWVGSYLHGRAADIAVESIGEISLVATDVIRHLPAAIKSVFPEEHLHE